MTYLMLMENRGNIESIVQQLDSTHLDLTWLIQLIEQSQ